MINVMVLLCYVNLSGMSINRVYSNCISDNLLLGGQFCTDYVDVQYYYGQNQQCQNELIIVPRLNFTCSGRITSIKAVLAYYNSTARIEYPFFQVWRAASVGSTIYNKIGEVQLQSKQITRFDHKVQRAHIILTGNNTIEVQSRDIVGYYHPPESHYLLRTITDYEYKLYVFSGSFESVHLNGTARFYQRQRPLIQFTIGKCEFYYFEVFHFVEAISIQLKRYITLAMYSYHHEVTCIYNKIHKTIFCLQTNKVLVKRSQFVQSLKLYIIYIYSRTSIIRISIIRTLSYPNTISNFRIPIDGLIFCKTK